MASNFPPTDGEDPGDPPRTPRLKLKDEDTEPLSPDTEEHVSEQTDGIFRNFVFQMYNNEKERTEGQEDTPEMPELTAFPDESHGQRRRAASVARNNPPSWQVGRQLAIIGDDINERYAPQFGAMINMLSITPDTAYEAFAGLARKLFREGISWGRVITLLCFGYRIAVTVVKRGIMGFFHKLVGFICKFVFVEKIAQWIAEQGGWLAVMNYVPETVGWATIGLIFTVAAASVIAVFYLSRKQS